MSHASSSFSLLHEEIKKWIFKQKWNELRAAQVETIKAIRTGSSDLVICAPTASGKTEAAFLPLLSNLLDLKKNQKGYIFYISPLKALINDQCERLNSICSDCYIDIVPWHGDVSQSIKTKGINSDRAVFLITPESVEAMLVNKPLIARRIFKATCSIVIDEFHSFVGTDRGEQLLSLLNRLEKKGNNKPRRIALSATLGDVDLIKKLINPINPNSVVNIDSSKGSNYSIKLIIKGYENHLIEEDPEESELPKLEAIQPMSLIIKDIYKQRNNTNLVFPNSRKRVEEIVDGGNLLCSEANLPKVFYAHHGFLSKDIREDVEATARAGEKPMTICCTSTLEMGIDIGNVDTVFQVGAPPSVSSLRQRLGRSGRRGKSPILRTSIIEPALRSQSSYEDLMRENLLQAISCLSLIQDDWYESPEREGISLSIIAHQILAIIAQEGGSSASILWSYLSTDSLYKLGKESFKQILYSLSNEDLIIQMKSGMLHLSEKGERYSNNYDFYSVFLTEEEYQILSQDRRIGSIPIRSMLAEGDFLLFAGKRWEVIGIDNKSKSLSVIPCSVKGKAPSGNGEFNVHTKIRQRMKKILNENDVPTFIDNSSSRLLNQARESFFNLGLNEKSILRNTDGLSTWFPWVGTRAMNGIVLLVHLLTGEKPRRSSLTISSSHKTFVIAKNLLQETPKSNLRESLLKSFLDKEINIALPGSGKWSWALSSELQLIDSFNREVNLEESINVLNQYPSE